MRIKSARVEIDRSLKDDLPPGEMVVIGGAWYVVESVEADGTVNVRAATAEDARPKRAR